MKNTLIFLMIFTHIYSNFGQNNFFWIDILPPTLNSLESSKVVNWTSFFPNSNTTYTIKSNEKNSYIKIEKIVMLILSWDI